MFKDYAKSQAIACYDILRFVLNGLFVGWYLVLQNHDSFLGLEPSRARGNGNCKKYRLARSFPQKGLPGCRLPDNCFFQFSAHLYSKKRV